MKTCSRQRLFELMSVNQSARSGGKVGQGIFCVLIRIASMRRFSRVHTIYPFQYKKENHPKYPKSATMGFFSKGLKNEFETAMVNEPSVFEPLKGLLYLFLVLRVKYNVFNDCFDKWNL